MAKRSETENDSSGGDNIVVAFRPTPDLHKRLLVEQERMTEEMRFPVSLSRVVCSLLLRAFEAQAEEQKAEGKKK